MTPKKKLYKRENQRWEIFRKISTGQRTTRSHKYISTRLISNKKPTTCVIASAYKNNKLIIDKVIKENGMAYNDYVINLPKGNKWLIGEYKTSDKGKSVAKTIRKGNAKAISDRSFKDYIGTSA